MKFLYGVLISLLLTPSVWADDWTYTIRPGDDLWSIARDYCGSIKMAPRIAEHNSISDVYTLRVGSRIDIPADWLVFAPVTARITQIEGTVDHISSNGSIPAVANAEVGIGDILVTREGSVEVMFADESTITIQPGSRVLFNKLTAFGPAGMVDTHLRFSYGQGTSRVKPQNRGDRFRIETPEGIAAVRGTEFRVGYVEEKATANAETLTGEIAFQKIDVPQGFGVAAAKGAIQKESLLPPPDLSTTSEEAFSGELLRWRPVTGASDYIITWSAPDRPRVTYRMMRSTDPEIRASIEPGNYRLAVRAVSEAGIQGYDATQPIILKEAPRRPGSPKNLDVRRKGKELTLTWDASADAERYRINVTANNHTHVIETTETKAIYILPRTGYYEIDLTSQKQTLSSEAARAEVSYQHPWWLLLFAIPLLAL